MPCYDPRDNWDHSHSYELEKVLENLIEVLKSRRSYSEDIVPFKDLANEATKTLCSYLTEKGRDDNYPEVKDFSKQIQHWWIEHQDWDKNRKG